MLVSSFPRDSDEPVGGKLQHGQPNLIIVIDFRIHIIDKYIRTGSTNYSISLVLCLTFSLSLYICHIDDS